MSDDIRHTLAWFDWWLTTPAGVAYMRRRLVPAEYRRFVAWLRARAPFNHTNPDE